MPVVLNPEGQAILVRILRTGKQVSVILVGTESQAKINVVGMFVALEVFLNRSEVSRVARANALYTKSSTPSRRLFIFRFFVVF